MASIAVPMIFPPVHIDGEYFGDGAMRQATPLSPAIHLGADRILVIGVRDETADAPADPETPQSYPSFAADRRLHARHAVHGRPVFGSRKGQTRINQLIDSVPRGAPYGEAARMRPIDTMIVVPSEDLRVIAHRHREALPVALRTLLRGISGRGRARTGC